MNKSIAILTTGHPAFDERIFYKFAHSFSRHGCRVKIISSYSDPDILSTESKRHNFPVEGVPIEVAGINENDKKDRHRKIACFTDHLDKFRPDVVICCEPMLLLAANRYKKKIKSPILIFSDITEWYPDNYVSKFSGLKYLIMYASMTLFNIYATNLADRLIIGETGKAARYKLLSPLKKKTIIGYYPVLEYFTYSPPPFDGKVFTICFSGILSPERGVIRVIDVASELANRFPSVRIRLKLFGRFRNAEEKQAVLLATENNKNAEYIFADWTEYTNISEVLRDTDICIDLREGNFIYRNSLPIKIFEYMACGKPVIYPDIEPIRNELNVEEFGCLVDTANISAVADKIACYISDNTLLLKHSLRARELTESKYNWSVLEPLLLQTIETLCV
ncbi:MAG: glycosyltransferase [Bacteroidota bacterium]